MITYSAPDFTQHPPRSPRVRLGGYVHLPRLLDKARACAAGKLGEFIYPCPLDKRFFAFTGIDPDAFLTAVKSGKGDVEMLAWVNEHTKPARTPPESAAIGATPCAARLAARADINATNSATPAAPAACCRVPMTALPCE